MKKQLGDRSGENRNCLNCGVVFYVYPYQLRKGFGNYCSSVCYGTKVNKGDKVGYSGLHAWIRKERGRPVICEQCGSDRSVQWANKSHKYKRDLNDWLSLCKKCHTKYDNSLAKAWKTRRENGCIQNTI